MDAPTEETLTTGSHHPTVRPYGSWHSPVTARIIAEGGVGINLPQSVGESLYWVELRPTENGRYAVVRRAPDRSIADVTPEGRSARTLVHEYGGGMYVAFRNGHGGESVIFSDQDDQRLYRQDLEEAGAGGPARWSAPVPLTPAPPADRAHRYADGRVTPDGRLLVTVRERHLSDGEVVNDLVCLSVDGSNGRGAGGPDEPQAIASGHDFYAAPRVSADGRRVAWISWDHPSMPWDDTELWAAELADDGSVSGEQLVAGGPGESVLQPLWSPSGELWYASDRTGWYNLYAVSVDQRDITGARADLALAGADPLAGKPHPCALATRAAEFAAVPWVFGLQHFAFLDDGRLVTAFAEDGSAHLAVLDSPSAATPLRELSSPYSNVNSITPLGRRIGLIGATHTESSQVVVVSPDTAKSEVVRRSRPMPIDPAYVSRPEAVVFPTEDGLTAHANYYAPTNPDFRAPEGELPPLLVNVHGGPTSVYVAMLDLDVQYWTSRGFAVVDVNYGGSTGYGREYRERLKGEWGVVDTVDSINAAKYLIARGDADPARVGIRGGSAGGYTTLNALTRFDFFTAGASLFGLADLETFATGGTHKFESQYLDSLVGPYPELREVYRARSPIHHVDDLDCPVILLQGLEDQIVPHTQADIIVEALRRKGLPFAYLPFEGEQHGFRKAENIIRAEEAELYFYGRVWGFEPADEIEPVTIENLA
jgi:dipeptidyl aminopeptidase/acylaminoacyl peptidase